MKIGEFLDLACKDDVGDERVTISVHDISCGVLLLYGGRYKNTLGDIVIPQELLDMEIWEMEYEHRARHSYSDYVDIDIYVRTGE